MQTDQWKIYYEDREIMVVYKPPGMPVQTAVVTAADLESLLKRYLAEKGEEPYLGIVHRLDQPVGGLLVFAKTQKAAALLSAQVQDGRMGKLYLARTVQKDEARSGKEGTMIDYLLKDGRSNLSRVVDKNVKGAKCARLDYRFISDDTAVIHLKTGRHHQIRVQFASRGWGLCGDLKYAGDSVEAVSGKRIFPALLSWKLTLLHPVSGKQLEFELDRETIEGLGYTWPNGV